LKIEILFYSVKFLTFNFTILFSKIKENKIIKLKFYFFSWSFNFQFYHFIFFNFRK